MILDGVDQAVRSGARLGLACKLVGISVRTFQRWKRLPEGEKDRRKGPKSSPGNSLSKEEEERVIHIVNSPAYRNLSPKQIVPILADQGIYVASESTIYRILRKARLNAHRAASKPSTHRKPREHVAMKPNEVWTWDITYLKGPIRGTFFYLYMIVDIFSRKIVGYGVEESECTERAASLILQACRREGIERDSLVLHQDNGSPMRGATLKATLDKLGITASYSRPHVSDDNPYSESLFRTLKYRPEYPTRPFASLEDARNWVDQFVVWYNTLHHHSAIRYVTPVERHEGKEVEILAHRERVYKEAKRRHPERWSGETRNWEPIKEVYLNPVDPQNRCTSRRCLVKEAS